MNTFPHGQRFLRLLIGALMVALIASGCTDGGSEPGSMPGTPSETPVVQLGDGPGDQVLIKAVTSAGIEITDADGASVHVAVEPATRISLTTEQVVAMSEEAEAGSGHLGSELDGLGRPRTKIPFSALLVGYARGVDTPAAKLSRRWLAKQDLTHPDIVIFPTIVLLLFASDAAHAMGWRSTANRVAPAFYVPAAAAAGGLCSEVTSSLYKGINAVFDALHINQVNVPKTGIAFLDGLLQGMADLVVAGVNVVIEAGRWLVIGLAKFSIGYVLEVVAKVAALAAMVGEFVAAIGPMRIKVEADPRTTQKTVPPAAENHVQVTVTASTDLGFGDLEWPSWFADCAKQAGAPLPPLKPVGEKIDWIVDSAPGLVRQGEKDKELSDGGPGKAVGHLDLVAGTEESADGTMVSRDAEVLVIVKRTQVAKLRDALVVAGAGLLTGNLPPFMKTYLNTALLGIGRSATDGLVALFNGHGRAFVTVEYHDPDERKPPKPKPGEHVVWQGTWASNKYDISGTFTLDVTMTPTAMEGNLSVHGSDCISAGTLTSEIDGSNVHFGLVKGGRALINFAGTLQSSSMSGTFVSGVDCGNDVGTWRATSGR